MPFFNQASQGLEFFLDKQNDKESKMNFKNGTSSNGTNIYAKPFEPKYLQIKK
jgi:hypothetical protein